MNEEFEKREPEGAAPPDPEMQRLLDRLEAPLPEGVPPVTPPEPSPAAPEEAPPAPEEAPGFSAPAPEVPPRQEPAPEPSPRQESAPTGFSAPSQQPPQGSWNGQQTVPPRQGYYQGNGYYAPPAGNPGPWQGQPPYPPQPGQPGPANGTPYGWQQGYCAPDPRTTGWQQPQQPWPGQWQGTTGGWNAYPPPFWQNTGYQPQNPGGWGPSGNAPAAPMKKKKKRGFLRVLLGIFLILAALALLAMAGYGVYTAATGENPLARPGLFPPSSTESNQVPDVTLRDKPSEDTGDGSASGSGILSNTEIYNKVSPSVVAIVARYGSTIYETQGQGSGIILSEDGYIITNAHLVTDAVSFEVVLPDGESYRAEVVGTDPRNDLAVLKVNAQGLTCAEFGNSDQTEVGERVCVIGNPGGLRFQNSLTVGYVSALNRSVYINNYTINCIQTDAAINPGNSGGPLINAYGQVIGISSAKIALEEYEGICFAIPISEAMPILRQLIAEGKVTGRAMLGITASAVKASEAEFYEIPLGLWVQSVVPGADIARKGVREGDIITHINNQPVYSLDACSNILKEYSPGDTVAVTIFRREGNMKDNTFTVEIVLESS